MGIVVNLILFVIVYAVSQKGGKNIQLRDKYKSVVINKLINNFYSNVKYLPRRGMPEQIYKNKYESYDSYSSEDYFEAKINGKYNIQMAEILTQSEQTKTNSKGETETEIVTEFEGLVAKVQMKKTINNELSIMQSGTSVLQDNMLKMDYSEFEKCFDVFC